MIWFGGCTIHEYINIQTCVVLGICQRRLGISPFRLGFGPF